MKLAVVAAVGSYTPEDLEHKKRSLRTVLRPDTHLDMFAANSGVQYVESSLELYLSEVAVARKVVVVVSARGGEGVRPGEAKLAWVPVAARLPAVQSAVVGAS